MIGDFWNLLVQDFGFRKGNLTFLEFMQLLFVENQCENSGFFRAGFDCKLKAKGFSSFLYMLYVSHPLLLITYLSLGRRLKKYGKNFRVLGENKVSLGYRPILAEFIITLGALKKLAMN